jgi:hypothetical protein
MKRSIFLIFFLAAAIQGFSQFESVATHFEGLGTPYGGCGVPEELVESEHFVALNVFNRPDYPGQAGFTQPIEEKDFAVMGEFQNGKNCGRWVKVTILDDCKGGSNGGDLGEIPCENGTWTSDQYNDAVLYMVVTDACGDNNAWCREIPKHLDLHTSSLNQFEKNSNTVNNMNPNAFNNRKIRWEYVPAPNYQGDIRVHFMKNSQMYWASILITNLPNGIHGVQQKINNTWTNLEMNSDMGQAYLLKEFVSPITIRVLDANDELIFDGREYQFSNPCYLNKCTEETTEINYQKTDCDGVMNGTAFVDSCGTCSGGLTGNTPVLDLNFCKVTATEDGKNPYLNIYPNPATRIVHIAMSDYKPGSSISILDSKGNVVYEKLLKEHSASLNIENLTSGIYLVRIGELKRKLIVE